METEDNKAKLDELTSAIHERMASLDAPVRDLLMSDDYIVKLSEILNAHSLKKDECAVVEEITTNFLLGTIRPTELEQAYTSELTNLTKDNIRAVYNDIRSKILSPVWNTVESAWAEDDENEKIFNEVVELSDVPLPPSLQSKGVDTVGEKVNKEIAEADRLSELGLIKPKPTESMENNKSWEEKVSTTSPTKTESTTRVESDRSLPQIGSKNADPYREIPEL